MTKTEAKSAGAQIWPPCLFCKKPAEVSIEIAACPLTQQAEAFLKEKKATEKNTLHTCMGCMHNMAGLMASGIQEQSDGTEANP